jgi:putative membrane protein
MDYKQFGKSPSPGSRGRRDLCTSAGVAAHDAALHFQPHFKEFTMPSNIFNRTTLAAAATAFALAAAPGAWAQSGSSGTSGSAGAAGSTGSPGSTSGSTSAGGAARADARANANNPDASKLDRSDRGMIEDLAQANMAEIDAGKMALEKSQNADVKKFAQHMVDDHTKALGEVQALATAKNVTLPDGAGPVAKTKATALKAMSGNLFDKEYAKRAGVGDHESTVKLLQKIQKDGKDSDLKALAGKMLPTVEHHLDMAKQLPPAKS